MERNKTIGRNVFLGLSLCVLFIVGIYNLTHASLWYDETIEFFYSKYIDGPVHDGGRGTTDMYDRITSTFQPPLYNFVMHFWLKVSTSEWWFRFFGVVMGVVGGLGIFKAVEKTWNYKAASAAVIMLAFTLRYIYYMQEAAEYTVLLASLGWLVYTWLRMIENTTAKNIFCYLVVACLAMYSQYGAAFPVMAFSLVAYVTILIRKNKVETRRITIGYVCATVMAGLPLWLFFIRKQMEHQKNSMVEFLRADVCPNIIEAIYQVTGWCFNSSRIVTLAAGLFLAAVTIYALIKSKNNWLWSLVAANVLCWLIYYAAVRMSLYGYGKFTNRYCLFFIPVWTASAFCITGEAVSLYIKEHTMSKWQNVMVLHVIPILVLIGWSVRGWHRISPNWQKEDIRGVVNTWYDKEGYNIPTLVYFMSDSGFHYYVTRNAEYGEKTLDNVTVMPWYRSKPKSEIEKYIEDLPLNDWKGMYLISSHEEKEYLMILDCLKKHGYKEKIEKGSANENSHLVYLYR